MLYHLIQLTDNLKMNPVSQAIGADFMGALGAKLHCALTLYQGLKPGLNLGTSYTQ